MKLMSRFNNGKELLIIATSVIDNSKKTPLIQNLFEAFHLLMVIHFQMPDVIKEKLLKDIGAINQSGSILAEMQRLLNEIIKKSDNNSEEKNESNSD